MSTPARPLLVIGTLALSALPTGQLAVIDTREDQLLGEAVATLTPFRVGGKLVLAGPQERPDHHMTVIVTPFEADSEYPVKNGGWMTPPIPYERGQVTMIAQDRDGRELFRLEARPEADGFRPVFGPDWTSYGPR